MLQNRTIELMSSMELLASISELEHNVADEIRRHRSCERFETKCPVIVRPGNSTDRAVLVVEAVSGDVSASGCLLLSASPLAVGDVYWLTFDKNILPIGPLFARCVRCRLLNEDAFEAGLQFFTQVTLPDSLNDDDLLD